MSIAGAKNTIIFIGVPHARILGNKLPSRMQVLSVFFYNHRELNLTISASANMVAEELLVFWKRARVPTQEKKHCVNKVISLHKEWIAVTKNINRRSFTQQRKEADFANSLEDLFDVAAEKALQTKRQGAASIKTAAGSSFNDHTIEEMECDVDDESEISEFQAPIKINLGPTAQEKVLSRGKREFINERIVSALDKCKISDRDAVHILIAVAEGLGHNVNDLIINRTSIRRMRSKYREAMVVKLKASYRLSSTEPCVLHFDGKILPDINGTRKVDRLPVIVSNRNGEQLLGVPLTPDGTGQEVASAVYDVIDDWGLLPNIQAICCDTTAANMGQVNGACSFLQQKIGRDLMMLPCRHHIMELILKSVFDVKMGSSSAPVVLLFKRFQSKWNDLDTANYKTALDDDYLNLSDIGDDIIQFCKHQLSLKHSRHDYEEFLQLVIAFLGGILAPSSKIRFRTPGAFHHARWMAKAIYCLKIYLFREQFQLTTREMNGIRDICQFIVRVYVKIWFCAPLPVSAPSLDFKLLLDLLTYSLIDKDISRVTLQKMCRHLWYLSYEAIGLAFFDETIPFEVKKNMVRAISGQTEDKDNNCHFRYLIQPGNVHSVVSKTLDYFVSRKTMDFFKRFNTSTDFMQYDPSLWAQRGDYIRGSEVVGKIMVVNDVSERKVKLMEEFNSLLTKDEDQKQFLLLTVDRYRKSFQSHNKSILVSNTD